MNHISPRLIAERLMNDFDVESVLRKYIGGKIDADQMAKEIQILAENAAEFIQENATECFFE